MKEISISLQTSGEIADIQIEHDDRKYDEDGRPYFSDNVDVSRSGDNWYWENNKSIQDFYLEEFEGEYLLQIERTRKSHPERLEGKAATYYDEIMGEQMAADKQREEMKKNGMSKKDINKKMSAKAKVAYQTIVQIGDREGDFGTLNLTPETKKQIKAMLLEFLEKWQKEHPQMKLINVAIHFDEVGADKKGGTVHMHITYCPVCTTYKKGMQKRNSLTGALKEMGYISDEKKGDDGFHLAVEKWQQKLRSDLSAIIERYGYKRLEPRESRVGHESTEDYQKRQDQKKTVKKNEQTLAEQSEQMVSNAKVIKSQEDEIKEKAAEIADIETSVQECREGFAEISKTLKQVENELRAEGKEAVNRITQAFEGTEYPADFGRTTITKRHGLIAKKEEVHQLTPEQFSNLNPVAISNPDALKKQTEAIKQEHDTAISRIYQRVKSDIKSVSNRFDELVQKMPILQKMQNQIDSLLQIVAAHKRTIADKDRELSLLQKQMQKQLQDKNDIIVLCNETIKDQEITIQQQKQIIDRIDEYAGDGTLEEITRDIQKENGGEISNTFDDIYYEDR